MAKKKYIQKYLDQRCDQSLDLPASGFDPDIIVVIPAYDESLNTVMDTIRSMGNQHNPNQIKYQIFILVNTHLSSSNEIKSSSEKVFNELQKVCPTLEYCNCQIHVFYHAFSERKSGVGHARKMLMDLAFRSFIRLNKNGLIVNLDADTLVEDNYISSIFKSMQEAPEAEAASIAFEHHIPSEDHPIVNYELHLRYFINMQRLIGLPFAFQTVGSAMVVRAWSYAKEGGMTRKQAGEDFYFLHKYSKNFSLIDIKTTSVMPSPRSSDRVPFGTGKAVQDALDEELESYLTYHFYSFLVLKDWIDNYLQAILKDSSNSMEIEHSRNKTIDIAFESIKFDINACKTVFNIKESHLRLKAFYNYFDAFKLMKYLHAMRELVYPDMDLNICCKYLFESLSLPYSKSNYEMLLSLKEYDRRNDFKPLDGI